MWMAQVAASGLRGTMAAAWPLARECRWLAARNPSLSFTRPSMRFFLPLLLLIRGSIPFPPSPFTLASPLYVVTSLIPGRQADRRTLKPCAQRAFPIFHLLSARQEEEALPRYPACVFPLLAGIKLLPRRELMLPAVNSSYFSRRVIRRAGASVSSRREGRRRAAR